MVCRQISLNQVYALFAHLSPATRPLEIIYSKTTTVSDNAQPNNLRARARHVLVVDAASIPNSFGDAHIRARLKIESHHREVKIVCVARNVCVWGAIRDERARALRVWAIAWRSRGGGMCLADISPSAR